MDVPQTKYVSVGEGNVAYQVFGEGAVDLVWVSGTGNIDYGWDYPPQAAMLKRLGSFCRVIVFDRRGFGASDAAPDDGLPRWERWIEDMNVVLDAADCERAAILGQLDAGPTAIMFSATQPARTTALILSTTTARYLADDKYPIGEKPEALESLVQAMRSVWGTEQGASVFSPDAVGDPEQLAFVARYQRSAFTPASAAAYFDTLLRSLDVRSVLSSVQVPTLVLHRSDFSFLPIDHGRWLSSHITGARFIEMPGSNPWLALQGDAAAVDEIEEFITGAPPVREPDRALATVLFTDIVSSTERIAEIGDRKWSELLTRHNDVVDRCLAQFRGRHVDSAGDGVLATFDGPARAIRCACAIKEAVRALGIEVRAGLHTGEVELAGDDVRGIAVHIAARVMAHAGAGEVIVSGTVKDLVAGSGIVFVDRGTHALKGVPDEWRLFAVES